MSARDTSELRDALSRKDIQWSGVVVVCPPRAVDEALADTGQLDLALSRTLLVADVVKTLSQIGARNSPRLWIVTRGAQQLDAGDRVTLAQTQLRGIARVLTFEHPELKTTLVDVEADGTGSAAALIEELLAGRDHDEVALREGQRYIHRLVPAPITSSGELTAEPRRVVVDFAGTGAVRLQVDQPGRLDALTVHAVPRTPPQADQVEVRVRAAGLNFSDVLKTMGVYPGLDGTAPVLGVECVGIVTAVGAGVDSVEIGQRVVAFGPGTFGTHVTTLADLVVAIPDDLPDRQAATFGAAYLTSWHSLCEVGRLAPGERVLIHSATGGVGLAAVSIAKMIGARIYATAGTQTKRELLSGLGVDYVGDSRSRGVRRRNPRRHRRLRRRRRPQFVVGRGDPGRGARSWLPGGRFVELGKKDVYADASLGLRALAGSASFAVVDLDLNLRLQPRAVRSAAAGDPASRRRRRTAGAPRHRVHPGRRGRRVRPDGLRKPHRQDRHLDTGRRQHRGRRPCATPAAGSARRRVHRGRRDGRSRFRLRQVAGRPRRGNGCPQRTFGSQRRCRGGHRRHERQRRRMSR